MKPGPATSTFETVGSSGMWATIAEAIFAGAMRARRADLSASVDVQSPLEELAGRSMPSSSTSNDGRSPTLWASATAFLSISSIVSDILSPIWP